MGCFSYFSLFCPYSFLFYHIFPFSPWETARYDCHIVDLAVKAQIKQTKVNCIYFIIIVNELNKMNNILIIECINLCKSI